MCVRWYVSPDRVVYLMAGFEDGSMVSWDCRNNTSELTTLKLFSEPGNIQYVLHLITSVRVNWRHASWYTCLIPQVAKIAGVMCMQSTKR